MRVLRARLSARALRGLSSREAGRVQLQAAGFLSELRRTPVHCPPLHSASTKYPFIRTIPAAGRFFNTIALLRNSAPFENLVHFSARRRHSINRAQILGWTFVIDTKRCPRRGDGLQVTASINEPRLIRKILEHARLREALPDVIAPCRVVRRSLGRCEPYLGPAIRRFNGRQRANLRELCGGFHAVNDTRSGHTAKSRHLCG